jgi:hypothetical protein
VAITESPRAFVVDEPTVEDGAVVLRVAVEDPDREDDPGGVFVCRMTAPDEITVETFPVGSTPSSDGESRAEAVEAALAWTRDNKERFSELLAQIQPPP